MKCSPMSAGLRYLLVVLCILVASRPAYGQDYDVVIENGLVIDGSGRLPAIMTVAIRNAEISYVGPRTDLSAEKRIDATGLVVAPGFIDVHNHSELLVQNLTNPDSNSLSNEAFVRQGVTLVVIGPDGLLGPAGIRRIRDFVRTKGSSTHVAAYAGHNAIRTQVMGAKAAFATSDELNKMKALVEEAMEIGAVGLSTGLMYAPGMYSDTNEVVELAKVVARYGGSYDSHVRNPVFDLLGSYREAIEIGNRAGIRAKIAHAKVVGKHNDGKFSEVRALINDARSRGANIVTDQYPYDGAATSKLHEIVALPAHFSPAGEYQDARVPPPKEWVARLLSDPHVRAELKLYNEEVSTGFTWAQAVGYGSFRIVACEAKPELIGQYIVDIARDKRSSEFDVISNMIVDPSLDVTITLGAVSEENVQDLMVQPWNMIASDGAWSDRESSRLLHPRSTGTFTRVLGHYVRELGVLDISTAVRKMSTFPAEFMGFSRRGRIKQGYFADVAIFDPTTVRDQSDWLNPDRYSVGMIHVIVGGTFVLENEHMTPEMPGQFVELPRDQN